MTEWIWLVIGAAWGIWINLGDAKHYKDRVELQNLYIEHLHRKMGGDKND